MTGTHGYGPYTSGCRCDICRKAKADYMRTRRATARAIAQSLTERYVADIEAHGTRYGYEEKGCRCPECTQARTGSDAVYARRPRERKRNRGAA